MASLQSLLSSNYEFRCSLLDSCSPSDIILLTSATGQAQILTRKEKMKYLAIFELPFKNYNVVNDLCESKTNVTIVCQHIDQLRQALADNTNQYEFDILVVLTRTYRAVPLLPECLGEAFEPPRVVADRLGGVEWYESSARLGLTSVNIRFMKNTREVVTPIWLPYEVAARYMDIKLWSQEVEATAKYLHMNQSLNGYQRATASPDGALYFWSANVEFGFRISLENGRHANLPFLR